MSWRSGNSFRQRGDKPNVRIIAAPQPDQTGGTNVRLQSDRDLVGVEVPVAAGVSPAILSLVTRHSSLRASSM